MPRSSFALFLLFAVGAFFAWGGFRESSLAAQEPETPRITTVDGVKLNAIYYPSPKKNSPVAIMLHPIGPDKSSKGADWKRLAQTLQKSGYAVMMFDFRGHGDSTEVDPQLFWSYKPNKALVKTKEVDTIKVDDFLKTNNGAYLPVLINDIAAVKAYLDRRNDEGACNTANTIVIGADNGATLGAVWINSEWYRYKFTPHPMFPQLIPRGQFSDKPEGTNIIAGVFLTIQPKLGLTGPANLSIPKILDFACKNQGMAASFVCGKEDAKAWQFAKTLQEKLKIENSKKHAYIGKAELDTALSGVKLLQPALKLDKNIVEYLEVVVENKGNEWTKRDARESTHLWRMGLNGPFFPSHKKGELNLHYEMYDRFILR